MSHVVFFVGKKIFWVTGSRGSRCVFLVYFVSGTHGHAGHVVFLQYCFWVTESRWSRGSRCVFLEENLIPGHRVTKLGHVCDPIVSSITSVTLVHGSQGHAGHVGHVVFF